MSSNPASSLDNLTEGYPDCLEEIEMPAKIDDAELQGCESSDLIQGALEMLIPKTFALEPMHGYGVTPRIEQISGGVFRVNRQITPIARILEA
jgi:hypothetical protein